MVLGNHPLQTTRAIMTVHRRYLTQQGESLLSPTGALEQLNRCQTWSRDTGLPFDRISSGLASVPLPIAFQAEPGTHPFAGVNPVALWSPLFWLPEQVAYRQRWRTEGSNEIIVEDEYLWHTRVALQLTESGLYSPERGWLDVLSVYNLDISDPNVVARVREWLAGGEDPILDSIDLSDIIEQALPIDDAIAAAADIAAELKRIQWGVQADSLIQLLDETKADPATTNSALRAETVNVAYLGAASFSDLPWENGPASEHESTWSAWAADVAGRQYRNPAEFVEYSFNPIYNRLHAIRTMFWPSVVTAVRTATDEVGANGNPAAPVTSPALA
jgi:hypothetical protein